MRHFRPSVKPKPIPSQQLSSGDKKIGILDAAAETIPLLDALTRDHDTPPSPRYAGT